MVADAAPGFSTAVAYAQVGDVDWALTREHTYRALDGTVVTVPEGAPTDGASVPRIVSWLVPRSGRYLPAAVVHDHAYRVLIPEGELTYQRADRMLLEGMRLLRVAWLLRWTIFAAVRLAGLLRGRAGRTGWWRDAPRVLPIALLVAPIVVPPAVVVAVALAVFWAVEWVAFGVLAVCGRPDRFVNRPRDLTRV